MAAMWQVVSLGSLYSFMQLMCYSSEHIYVDVANPSPLLGVLASPNAQWRRARSHMARGITRRTLASNR